MNTARRAHVLIEALDAVELIEIAEFLCCWFRRDHDLLADSLNRFSPDYGLADLQRDLRRCRSKLSDTDLVTKETTS